MTAQTMLNNAIANGFDRLSPRDVMLCILQGAGSGGGGGVPSGNYAGAQPNFTPSTDSALAIDTSNGALWEYYSGAWH